MPPIRMAPYWEINLNTIGQFVGLVIIGLTAAGFWFGLQGKVAGLMDWKVEHEAEVKERRASNDASVARLTAMLSGLDERLDAQEALSVRLSDRQAATEARSAELAQTLRELQVAINQQSRDLSVILSWIDEQRRKSGDRK